MKIIAWGYLLAMIIAAIFGMYYLYIHNLELFKNLIISLIATTAICAGTILTLMAIEIVKE